MAVVAILSCVVQWRIFCFCLALSLTIQREDRALQRRFEVSRRRLRAFRCQMARRKAAVVLTTASVLQVLLSTVYREPRLVWCLERYVYFIKRV